MKRMICLLLSAVMVFLTPAMTVFAKPVWPSDTGIQSEAGIVMDMDSQAVLFGQNIHVQKAPASITKLLTALIVVENSNLTDTVTFSHDAVYDTEAGSGNKLSLEEGDILSVEDCLYALLLQSSNQSANALAEHVAGSREAFVAMMNKKIAELGCEKSHFANPSGLNDDSQFVTAYDMALIGIAAYSNETLLKINSAKSYSIPATKNNPNGASFAMEHKLLITTNSSDINYFPDAVAGKTGYTSIAGQTLVTYAVRDGKRLICVTLKSTSATHYSDTIALLNFGFDRFMNINIYEQEKAAAGDSPVTINETAYDASDISMDQNAVITVPRDAAFTDAVRTVETDLPENHPKGAVARLVYTYDDRTVGTVYIISAKQALVDETATDAQNENGADSKNGGVTASAEPKNDEGRSKTPIKLPINGIVTAMAILVLAALVCGGFFLYRKKKEEERRMLAERRRRRRMRLEEMGCSEEEFERLLEKRTGGVKKSQRQ